MEDSSSRYRENIRRDNRVKTLIRPVSEKIEGWQDSVARLSGIMRSRAFTDEQKLPHRQRLGELSREIEVGRLLFEKTVAQERSHSRIDDVRKALQRLRQIVTELEVH